MNNDYNLGSLLDRIRTGDRQAVESLLARIRPYLHLLARQHLHPNLRPGVGDSDVVQETLMKINDGLNPDAQSDQGHFRGKALPEFLAWAGRILYRVVIDFDRHGRAKKRDRRKEVPGSKLLDALAGGTIPEEVARRAEKSVQLAAALQRLPQHQREVLEWRAFQQLSYAEISERTGKSEGALRVAATRAMEALRSDGELQRLMGASS